MKAVNPPSPTSNPKCGTILSMASGQLHHADWSVWVQRSAKHVIWFVLALAAFNWGYTYGGYDGMEIQANYTRFEFSDRTSSTFDFVKGIETNRHTVPGNQQCYEQAPNALHQYTPFPTNLMDAIRRIPREWKTGT